MHPAVETRAVSPLLTVSLASSSCASHLALRARRSLIVLIPTRPAPPPGAVVVTPPPPPLPPRRVRLKLPEAQDEINGAAEEKQDTHDQATNLAGIIGTFPLKSATK